jgi:GH15 family glucan-1,4-alpha-glucosidase
MPEDDKQDLVDIDTSGPGAEVELEEEKVKEVKEETTNEQDKTYENEREEKLDEAKVESKTEEVKVEEVKEETKKEEPKEELEQYSEGVQKRIAKLTKKWREAERQKEAALEYARGGQVELSQLKTKVSKLEPSYVNAVENRVISGLAAAKSKLMRAREAGDIDAEVDAQKEIGRLGMEEVRVNTLKNKLSETKETEVKTPSLDQALQTPPADPKAEEWAEKNEWFGKDSAMTYTAFDLHKKLVNEQGFDPKSDEYYSEIDKQIKLDFPHKFAKGGSVEPTKTTQLVASATRSVQPGRKTVRLTSSQVSIAKKLGVPLEDYAKQLKITEGV